MLEDSVKNRFSKSFYNYINLQSLSPHSLFLIIYRNLAIQDSQDLTQQKTCQRQPLTILLLLLNLREDHVTLVLRHPEVQII